MNRTDRLYALVEELRAVAPRTRSARVLAERFEVSVRTIERDLGALQQAGVPIWAQPGRSGGYGIDPDHTLPPVNFTPTEATAVALALARVGRMPYGHAARSALRKVMEAMGGTGAERARDLAERIVLLGGGARRLEGLPPLLEQAVLDREVLRLRYADKDGSHTERDVEPVGFVGAEQHWYLVGWCRLRQGGRSFRVDRILRARGTGETAPARPLERFVEDIASSTAKLGFGE